VAGVDLRRWLADPVTLLAVIGVGVTASLVLRGRPGEPAVLLTAAAVIAAVALSGST
jgi:hypothetical protein